MDKSNWTNTIRQLTMPEQMKKELVENCKKKVHTKNTLFRYSRLITASAVTAALLLIVSVPAYAGYDLHQTKNLNIYFDSGISMEQIESIGRELHAMEDIYSMRYVGPEEAWQVFANEYLTDELAACFTENPLADSASYRVTVKLGANTEEVRNQIAQLEGVRHIFNLYEMED